MGEGAGWVEETSQRAVRADLGEQGRRLGPGSQVFRICWDTRAGSSAVQPQAVWVALAGTSAHCAVLSCRGPRVASGRVRAAPGCAMREEQSWVSGLLPS